jgi:hypothetical protein
MSTSKTLVGILVALFIGFAIGLFGKLGIEPVSCPVESVTANYGDSFWTIDSQIGCKGGLNKQDRISQLIKFNGGQDQIRQGQLVIFPTK